MSELSHLLEKYGENHQNATNKLFHWFCVPAIFFSLIAMITLIPFPLKNDFYLNWATLAYVFLLLYYFRLSKAIFMSFTIIGILVFWLINFFQSTSGFSLGQLFLTYFLIFAIAWVGQFIGHGIEGKKPSFLEDLKFLVIGPVWVISFLLKKFNSNV
jgi:uncharacterized membrane protein YGL010W